MNPAQIAIPAATYILGVLTPIVFKDYWDRLIATERAARRFRKEFEPVLGTLGVLRPWFERRNGLLDNSGPKGLRPLVERLEVQLAGLDRMAPCAIDLRNDGLEKRVGEATGRLRQLHESLHRFVAPFCSDGPRPDLDVDRWSKQEAALFEQDLRLHYTPTIVNLLAELRALDRHPLARLVAGSKSARTPSGT